MPTAGPSPSITGLLSAYSESSFGSDESSNLASFTPIPYQEGTASINLNDPTANPSHALQNLLDYQEEIITGAERPTISFTLPLAPTGTAAVSGTTAIQGALGLLLSKCMGVEQLDSGTTVSTTWSTAGGGNLDTAANLSKGAIVGWTNASSKLECRRVTNISGAALTVRPRFSAAPQATDVINGGANYALSQDPDGSLNFALRGQEADDSWLAVGCQLDSISLSLPLDGTIPTAQFTWKGVKWLHEDDTTAGDFASISAATYTGFDPITGQAGDFIHAAPTGLTATSVHVSAVGFEPTLAYTAITSLLGVNGVYRWRLTRASGTPMVAGSFTTFYEDDTWWDVKANKTAKQFLYQIGTTAGETVVIHCSTAQVTDVQRGDSDQGIAGLTVSYKGRLDAGVTSPTTDLHRSPLRISFL